jgi:hypothetical protein
MPCYSFSAEGNSWAWSHTPADAAADFDRAQVEAEQMAKTSGRNWVVHHHDRQVSPAHPHRDPRRGDHLAPPRLSPGSRYGDDRPARARAPRP